MAGRHIPSSLCFRTLHPYLVIMPTCDLANFLNAIHNPEYQKFYQYVLAEKYILHKLVLTGCLNLNVGSSR